MKTAAPRKKRAKKSAVPASAVVPVSGGEKPRIPGGHFVLLGDCMDAMTELRDERGFREQVDLVYLDPPFNSKAEYSFIFGEENAAKPSVVAFTDAWQWEAAEAAYDEYIHSGAKGADFLKGMRQILGTSPRGREMLSYLTMMVPRLELMRQLLKPTGNIVLHCDQTASHYLKTAMDAIFGAENFRNEIIWCYRKWTNTANHLQRNHDVLLFYACGDASVFNKPFGDMTSRMKEIREQGYNDGSAHGKKILRVYDRDNPKARKKIEQGGYDEIYYIDDPAEGSPLPDYWDISIVNPRAKEKLGYPTQKPLQLLRRIVEMASNPGDIVLDPFCGCGTTLAACVETKRDCVGIDLEPFAATNDKVANGGSLPDGSSGGACAAEDGGRLRALGGGKTLPRVSISRDKPDKRGVSKSEAFGRRGGGRLGFCSPSGGAEKRGGGDFCESGREFVSGDGSGIAGGCGGTQSASGGGDIDNDGRADAGNGVGGGKGGDVVGRRHSDSTHSDTADSPIVGGSFPPAASGGNSRIGGGGARALRGVVIEFWA